jgi:predicted bacteriocin transport accessory protein
MLLHCSRKDNQKEAQGSPLTDSERFALEYPLVGKDNVFIYKNASETADILANGRGIVFIGYKECPWCQLYAVFLHDVAREMEIDSIYYCDIKKDRESNSDSYQRIVSILAGRLQYDDEGRPRVYVPDVSIVSRGRIITRDFEASKETLGYDTPQEYWNDERMNALKERLRAGMSILIQIISRSCNAC